MPRGRRGRAPRLSLPEARELPPEVVVREFREPTPYRDLALVWRLGSVRDALLPEVAQLLRRLPTGLVTPL